MTGWASLKAHVTSLKEAAERTSQEAGPYYGSELVIGMAAQAEVLDAVLAKMQELEDAR